MATPKAIPGYFTISDAAAYLGISGSLVRRYVRDGRIESFSAGDRIKLLPRSAVRRFAKIARNVGRPTAKRA